MREHRLDRARPGSSIAVPAWIAGSRSAWRRRIVVGAAGLALLATLARVVVNAPVTVPLDLASAAEPLATLGLVATATAALVLGATERDLLATVGLTFVGVFGLLAAISPGAVVPAAVAIPAGAGLVVAHDVRAVDPRRAEPGGIQAPGTSAPTPIQAAVATALLAGAAVSLAGALGVAAGTLRPAGSALALLGAGATPVFVRTTSRDWLVGGVAAAGVLTVAAAAPFVLGAVLLVGLGVVGTPLVVVAAGLGGLAVTASAALRRRRWPALAAIALLLAGGAPASAGSAVALALATVLLARGGVTPPGWDPDEPGPSTDAGGDPA